MSTHMQTDGKIGLIERFMYAECGLACMACSSLAAMLYVEENTTILKSQPLHFMLLS